MSDTPQYTPTQEELSRAMMLNAEGIKTELPGLWQLLVETTIAEREAALDAQLKEARTEYVRLVTNVLPSWVLTDWFREQLELADVGPLIALVDDREDLAKRAAEHQRAATHVNGNGHSGNGYNNLHNRFKNHFHN